VTRRPLVYVAHPVTCYGTNHERESLARIRRLLPGTRVLNPSARYASQREWLLDWPTLVLTLDAIVVFAADDASIGAGCVKEIGDALAHGIGVWVLRDNGLHELVSLRLLPVVRRTPSRCAIPVAARSRSTGVSLKNQVQSH
jgi:hypothetical protein